MDHETLGAALALAKKTLVDPELIEEKVEGWLDDHPEATTTVQDGAISYSKLDASLKDKADEVSQLSNAINVTTEKYLYFSGNVIDLTGVSWKPSRWTTYTNPFQIDNGVYYSNPFILERDPRPIIYPRKENGQAVQMVRTGDVQETGISLRDTFYYKIIVSGLEINLRCYNSWERFETDNPNRDWIYILSETPAYWVAQAAGSSVEIPIEFGLTKGSYNAEFVSYVEPEVRWKAKEWLMDLTTEPPLRLVENTSEMTDTSKLFTIPDGGIWYNNGNEFVEVKEKYPQFEQSYNLIDENKFLWDTWDSLDTYMYLENDYYFPVVGGLKICTNFGKPTFQFYDSGKTLLGSGGVVNRYALVDIPQNASWARMFINKSANDISIRGSVVVYEVPATVDSSDDQRMWVPPVKIKGDYVEGDIYRTAIPQNLDIDILAAAQYRAVRAFNKTRNAFRIATFNILVRHGSTGWPALKQELKDSSIDICAMQEVTNRNDSEYKRFVQNYLTLNTWHFKYGSEPIFDGTLTGKAVVSVYEIVSTEHYNNTVQGREYIKTVINLPQYKQSLHQFTLSVYSYHGDLAASNRLIEVSEILATIANDTSDFIVVCGDTNAFATEADEQGKRPTWEAWIAGGFTPIHYGEHRTVTADEDPNSIDQIFMGNHITCANYDIVNSKNYMIEDPNGNIVPISDHCMLYADLVFDFDAVLAELNEND